MFLKNTISGFRPMLELFKCAAFREILMPTLVVFAVCEKVIFDQRGGIPTLVSVLQGMQVVKKQGVPIPPDAVAPKPWVVFTWWKPHPADEGKSFRQWTEFYMPDGTVPPPGKQETTFTFVDESQRNAVESIGFPVGQEGIYKIKVWLESDSGEKVGEDHTYEIKLRYIDPPVEKSSEQMT